MGMKFVNNSEGTLAAPGIIAGATTLTLNAGEGLKFPTIVAASGDFFYATIVDQSGNREVIKVTEHQAGTDVFQVIERAVDSVANAVTPVAYAFTTNDRVQVRLPAIAILSPDGTKSDTFQIGTATTGITLKHDTQALYIRNITDAAYADMYCKGLTLAGALALGSNAISGVTTLAMSGALSGVTTLAMSGALSGVTNIGMSGTLGTVTDLTITGSISTPTNITASGTITAEQLTSTDDCNITDDLTVGGLATITGTSSIPIDNEATNKKIKARDHGTATTPEVVNVVYGTGSPPAASGTPIGTLFIKYIA